MSDAIIQKSGILNNMTVINRYEDRYINNYIYKSYKLHTEIITANVEWEVPEHSGTISVLCYGGGGAGGNAGGSGGFVNSGEFDISAGQRIPITIGAGGTSRDAAGGTTSFGTYISANGGSMNSGGSTGGNSNANAYLFGAGAGSNSRKNNAGIYGGGGGGQLFESSIVITLGGGTYGGGGGGYAKYKFWGELGTLYFPSSQSRNYVSNGGRGGTYGGGGAGNIGGYGSREFGGNGGGLNSIGSNGNNHIEWFFNSYNCINTRVSKGHYKGNNGVFVGNAYSSVYINELGNAKWIGGGGGGYGGRGGNSHSYTYAHSEQMLGVWYSYYEAIYAGGGGGGYCSNGGHARKNNHYQITRGYYAIVATVTNAVIANYNSVAAGGGGGGYFGDGGNCCGGGGGYGLTANGGDGAIDNAPHDGYDHQGTEFRLRIACGGGGGYFGKGGEGQIYTTYSGFTQITASTVPIHGGGGGYGNGGSILNKPGYGAGGCSNYGSYDTANDSSLGGNGICIIQYYVNA